MGATLSCRLSSLTLIYVWYVALLVHTYVCTQVLHTSRIICSCIRLGRLARLALHLPPHVPCLRSDRLGLARRMPVVGVHAGLALTPVEPCRRHTSCTANAATHMCTFARADVQQQTDDCKSASCSQLTDALLWGCRATEDTAIVTRTA